MPTKEYEKSNVMLLVLLAFIFIFVFSLAIGYRESHVGTDTVVYELIYSIRANSPKILFKYEPAFEIVTFFMSRFFLNPKPWFAFIVLLYFTFAFCLFRNIHRVIFFYRNDTAFLVTFFCLLSSSWFFVALVNGLKQGLSLPILYLSAIFFLERRYLLSFCFAGLSVAFHISSLSAVLFFPLFLLSFRRLFVFTVIIFLLYPLGLIEAFVENISLFLNLDIYHKIKNYAGDAALWSGFQWDLYAYTLFWFIVFNLFCIVKSIRNKLPRIVVLSRLYSILVLPYLFFGFGGYTNRWGVIAWHFIPFAQGAFIFAYSSKKNHMICAFIAFFFLALVFFAYRMISYGYLYL